MHSFALALSFPSFFTEGVFCDTGLGGVIGGSFFSDVPVVAVGEAVTGLSAGVFSFFTLTEFATGVFWGVEGGSCFI